MQTASLLRRIRDPWGAAAGLFLAGLCAFLALRAAAPFRWSDWGFADAQAMLSLRQWDEGGWLANHLLFKPQGYAAVIDLLDEPPLRHHAHGTSPKTSPRVGPRLLYTHYPSGHLLPYAALFRLGLKDIVAARMLSLLLSIGALALMFLAFSRLTGPPVAFLAVLFYGLSPSFLGYADSLVNQPIDDLLRFACMLSVILAGRASDPRARRRRLAAAWGLEFLLSLVSYDSVFFVYAWLVGFDLLERRGFRWKTYLVFALAPVAAHSLQLLQNVSYLGWKDALTDIQDSFLIKHGAGNKAGRLFSVLSSTAWLLDRLFRPGLLAPPALALYVAARRLLPGEKGLPPLGLLGVLFVCGWAFVIVLPQAARMAYQPRQFLPFASLLAGAFTWSLVPLAGRLRETRVRAVLPLQAALAIALWWRFSSASRTPFYNVSPAIPDVALALELRRLPTTRDPVYFSLGACEGFLNPEYVPGYPQIHPITEVYAGSRPILCFRRPADAATDLAFMARRGGERFSPVLVSREPGPILNTATLLQDEGLLGPGELRLLVVHSWFVLDLTGRLRTSQSP